MTENCRVKIARFFDGAAAPFFGFTFAAAFSALAGSTRVTWICSRRSAAITASVVSATRSPVTVWPVRVRPL
jgi:hypothetical protein